MKIACIEKAACEQVRGVLQRHGITGRVWWAGDSPPDERIWVTVNADIAPPVETAIRRDIEAIAGATLQE